MGALLPLEIIQAISCRNPCRERQTTDLAILYNGIFPSPRTLVAYGLEETHKLEILTAVLEARSLPHVVLTCRECLSQRHLLAKIYSACRLSLGIEEDNDQFERIDSINSLAVGLEKLFRKRDNKVILVLDAIDEQRGAGTTLLPALAKLGDLIPNISIIMTSNSPRPLQLHKKGVPYIHFPPYTRAEAVHLVSQQIPSIPSESQGMTLDELKKIYLQFAVTVYDSLIAATSSISISIFRNLCDKLWPRFIWPAISGEPPSAKSNKTATWDFGRLLIRNRSLFQVDGEKLLVDRLQPCSEPWTFAELREAADKKSAEANSGSSSNTQAPTTPTKRPASTSDPKLPDSNLPPLLKHFPTILLLSCYLASHTPQKNDMILFSRLSSSTKRIRKNRTPRKSIFKSPSKTPTKPSTNVDGAGDAGGAASAPATPSKNMQGRTRTLFDMKFGAPKAFALERAISILRAVHPDGFKHTRSVGDRVYREMGELERLRLVERVSGEDEAEGGGRWRCGVGREVVEGMVRGWGMAGGIQEWEIERED